MNQACSVGCCPYAVEDKKKAPTSHNTTEGFNGSRHAGISCGGVQQGSSRQAHGRPPGNADDAAVLLAGLDDDATVLLAGLAVFGSHGGA